MSIIDQHLDDVPEMTNLSSGEHRLTVTKVDVGPNKAGTNEQIVITLADQSEPNAWPVRVYLPLTDPSHEKYDSHRRMLKDFCEAFEVPIRKGGKIDTEDMLGKSAYCITKIEVFEGKEGAKLDRYVKPANI